MNNMFISLKKDIESGMTQKEIRDEILRIMGDSGYHVEGAIVRIRNFVRVKSNDIKSIKENHKKMRISQVIFLQLLFCFSNINL